MTLLEAIHQNDIERAQSLLWKDEVTRREVNEAFQKACELGRRNFVGLFLKNYKVDPTMPSIQAIDFSISPAISDSFGLQQAAYYGHSDVVKMLLEDGRSDPSAGNYRCIKLVLEKANSSDTHKLILKQLIDYCWNNYLDYKQTLGSSLAGKIQSILDSISTPNETYNPSNRWS